MTEFEWTRGDRALRVLVVVFLVVNAAAIVVDLTVGRAWWAPINLACFVGLCWAWARMRRTRRDLLHAQRRAQLLDELWGRRSTH